MQKYILGVVVVVGVLSHAADAPIKYKPGYCGKFTGEFVLSQDVSWSFREDRHLLTRQMPDLFYGLSDEFPDSRFGITTFSDKPYPSRGTQEDWCYRRIHELTTDVEAVVRSMNETEYAYGADTLESQLDALKFTMIEPEMGWSKSVHRSGLQILRIIFMATDADYHKQGDGFQLLVWDWLEVWRQQNVTIEYPHCLEEDYPSIEELSVLFKEHDIIPVFLVQPPGDVNVYWDLINQLGAGGTVQLLNSDSSNLIDAIMDAMMDVTCDVAANMKPTTSTSTTQSTVTSIVNATTTTTTTTANGLPVGAVVGAAVGLIVLIGAAAAGGVFYYNRNSSPYTQDRVLGEPDMETGEASEMRDEMARVDDSDFV